MSPLPVSKLFFLAVRQASKPVANRVKSVASSSPALRTGFIKFGRMVNTFRINVSRLSAGKESLKYAKPLSEDKAVQAGAEMAGEFVTYSVAGSIVVYEYWLSVQKDEQKKQVQLAREKQQYNTILAQGRRIRRLERRVQELENQKKWWFW